MGGVRKVNLLLWVKSILTATLTRKVILIQVRIIYLVSINYIQAMQQKQVFSEVEQQQQVNLINQLCRLQYNFPQVQKTIILYNLFNTPQSDQLYLHNLHTVAQLLIDSQAEVKVQDVKITKKQSFDKLTITNSKTQITKMPFEVEVTEEGKPPLLTNIFLYEKKGQTKTRVVVVPIQKDLTDISYLKREQEKLQKENKEKDQEFRNRNLQNQALKQAQEQWKRQKEEKFRNSCESAKDKHLKIFKVQAFLNAVLQKTETYSICYLLELTMNDKTTINQVLEQFNMIFNVPKQEIPQIILYNYDPADPKEAVSHELVTTRCFSENQKYKIEKMNCWDSKFFYKPTNVRTQIYQNMYQSDSKAISKVIQDFVESWNNVTINTASCIASIVKLVNQYLKQQKRAANVSLDESATDLNISTEIQNMTFPEAFQKYIHRSLWFPQKSQYKLSEFYTDEILGRKITVEKGIPKIPSSIQCLVYISYFNKLVSEFAERYRQIQTSSKNDQIVLLKQWKTHLKELYELTNSINKTFLDTSETKDQYMAEDMQRFFNFLMFTLDSSEKIKKITGRDIATATSLKSMFEQFRPKRDRLLSYIIGNEKGIKQDQPVQYYDLYLLVIKQNASQDIQNDLEYIELHIHELRAFRIATQYIWDNQQLVDAIRSYALICLKYEKLNENKRKLIKILDIERRMARLLKIVGQEQSAAEIYFKNREIFFANNCCKQVLSKCKGDEKAEILTKWGEKFEKEFEYDLANSYYLMAYSYARSPAEKKRALQHKMKLLEKRNRLPCEDERAKHDKFIKEIATEDSLKEFCSEANLRDMHCRLYKYLEWDSLLNCSGFSKVKNADVDSDLSMLASESALQKSSDAKKY